MICLSQNKRSCRHLFLTLSFLFTSVFSFAFTFDVTVKLIPPATGRITLFTTLNAAVYELKADSAGRIYYRGQLAFPSQCLLVLEYRKTYYRYNFFLFNDSKLTAIFDPLKKGNEWTIDGLCVRCKAFEKISALSKRTESGITPLNYEKELRKFASDVKSIPGIGTDEYTQLITDLETVKLKERLIDSATGKILFSSGKDPLLKKYLPPQEKYCGFLLYANYVSNYFLTTVYDSVMKERIKDGSMPDPIFLDVYKMVSAAKSNLPKHVYAEIMLQLLYTNRDPSYKDSVSTAIIKRELDEFIKNNPNHPQLNLVKRINDGYQHPLLKNDIPNIWLMDRKGVKFPSKALPPKYILLNTWSPSNATSISLCDTLERIVGFFNKDKQWIYLAHIALGTDSKKWMALQATDTLTGNQYIPVNNDFEKAFQLWNFPVTYIINPKGKVIYKGHPYSLTIPFLDKVLSGKLD